jgi:SHS2 domain-containing protein
MKRFEYREHTADLLIRAYGENLSEAFAAAADALFEIVAGTEKTLASAKSLEIRIQGIDNESLLVRFLSALIARHEIDRVVMRNFTVTLEPGYWLQATARIEPFVDAHHGGGTHIKGVPYHLLEIAEEPDGSASVQVLFDI